jgi:hypothetical protein
VIGEDSILSNPPVENLINYAPQLSFNYRLRSDSIRRSIQFKYNGSTSQPNLEQLDPTPDNDNPLHIRSGNPDLSPSFNHGISLEFSDNNSKSQQNFKASFTYNFIKDQIVSYTVYEPETGIQYTNPVNKNGSWNTSLHIFYSRPLDKPKRFRLNSQTRIHYKNQLGFSRVDKQSVENTAKTTNIAETLNLTYKNKWYSGKLEGIIRYSQTDYSLNIQSGRESYVFEIAYNTVIDLPKEWKFLSEFRYLGNRGLSNGYNKDEKSWNVVISKSILKNNGTILLQLNDILQESINIRRDVTNDYVQDIQYKSLTSYWMLSFNYRFNVMGKKEI